MSEHTPGPWMVGTRKPYVEVWGPMRMGASPILASMESEPREANARLMAAAPDLLAALKQCTARADKDLKEFFRSRTDECARDYALCMAAIAKAEGKP
jgi:hypothetical protein